MGSGSDLNLDSLKLLDSCVTLQISLSPALGISFCTFKMV